MSKPRGHSNVRADETERYPTMPDKASIPLMGGATVYTVKDLPPLALSREEWQEIGERMGWTKEQATTKPDPAREWWASLTQKERDEHIKKHWPLTGPPTFLQAND